MPSLKAIVSPTFKVKVKLPVPGEEPAQVDFTFRHRTRDELKAWLSSGQERSDVDSIMEMVTAWGFEEPLNRENVSDLVQRCIGSPVVLVQTYIEELTKARQGN